MAIKTKFSRRAAFIACQGSCTALENSCSYGCTGCGACVKACRFGAISIQPKEAAAVNRDACIGCGACVKACPRQLIHLQDRANSIAVACSNRDKGAKARAVCPVSCIGCGICQASCSASAVFVNDSCAVIDERCCLSCGMCAVKCPRHAIVDLRGILT